MTRLARARGPELRRDPRLPETLAECFEWRVREWPDGRICSYRPDGADRSLGYADLWERSARIASGLLERGAETGQPVILLADDVLDFAPAFWGCVRAGSMAVPLTAIASNPIRDERDASLRRLIALLDRPIVLFGPGFEEVARFACRTGKGRALGLADADELAPATRFAAASSPACLIATSGSTGRVKLVALRPEAILHRMFSKQVSADSPPTTPIHVMPLDSISGMRACYLTAETVVHMRLDDCTALPSSLLDAIERFGATQVGMTNSLASRLVSAMADSRRTWRLGSLRKVGVGAEPIDAAVIRKLHASLSRHGACDLEILATFGTTETGPLAAASVTAASLAVPRLAATQSVGKAQPGVEIRIVDKNGEVRTEGSLGKIEVRCPQVIFDCYWGKQDLSERCLTADGWYRTSDVGRLDDGELTVVGRAKDIIINSGKKHSLADIEGLVRAVRGGEPAYACAVRWPDEASESLAVVIVLDENRKDALDDAVRCVRGAVGRRFGLQARIFAAGDRDGIPVTSTGKPRRHDLAKAVGNGVFGTEIAAPIQAKVDADARSGTRLDGIWRQVLNIEGPFDPEADFFELGGDSLCALDLSTRVGEAFGIRVPPDVFFREPTFARLESLVAAARSSRPETVSQEPAEPWALPPELLDRQLSLLGTWQGERPTRSKLVVGSNTGGTRPPLFWITQNWASFDALSRMLSPDQPIYGLRSALRVMGYGEDEIQRLALRYVQEIAEVAPAGPVFVGGTCQGGIIALAVAQHLLRRGRHVPLLILGEWSFPFHHYGGDVLLIYGRDTDTINPFRNYRDPAAAWRHAFGEPAVVEIPCPHHELYASANVPLVASAIEQHVAASIARPPRLPTRLSCRAELSARDVPSALTIGETRTVKVEVRNGSTFAWTNEPFGLVLRSRWADETGLLIGNDACVALPVMPSGATQSFLLPVTPPALPGSLQFEIDVVDEGNTWRIAVSTTAIRFPIRVFGVPTEAEFAAAGELAGILDEAR